MQKIKPNGSEKYAKRIEYTREIVKIKKRLNIEHDELMKIQSEHLKQGRAVSNLRGKLEKAEDNLIAEYPNIDPLIIKP